MVNKINYNINKTIKFDLHGYQFNKFSLNKIFFSLNKIIYTIKILKFIFIFY